MSNFNIFVLSDSIGETAELLAKAGLSQFNGHEDNIHRIPYVDDQGTINEAVQTAKENNGLIAFTLVKPELRSYLLERASAYDVIAVDLLGPLLDKLEEFMGIKPHLEPGLVRKLDEDYYNRIEAVEFAVKYDDGRDAKGILKADLILIGLSRTSKTPLSQFLAHKQIKVANVPIVPEVDPPEELFQVDPKKCIGLKINSQKLNDIRRERLKSLGLDDTANYAQLERIEQENAFFEEVVERIGCVTVDVSNKAVEETANIILSMYYAESR